MEASTKLRVTHLGVHLKVADIWASRAFYEGTPACSVCLRRQVPSISSNGRSDSPRAVSRCHLRHQGASSRLRMDTRGSSVGLQRPHREPQYPR